MPDLEKDAIDTFTKNRPNHWREMASEWSTLYVNYVLHFDPFLILQEVKCPVLSLIGEKDVLTLPKNNSFRIREALEKGKCIYYHVEIRKDPNHLFQYGKLGVISEYSQIESIFDHAAMEIIISWIKRQTK